MYTIAISLIFICSGCYSNKKADMVIFSYDRPLQLYALLESTHTYIEGLGDIAVIIRASNDRYIHAYQEVQHDFPKVSFLMQKSTDDFKPLTHKATFDSPSEYIIFAVDDIIAKDFVNLSECINLLETYDAWGFYLRLGRNLTKNYARNCKLPLPPLTEVETNVIRWRFSQGKYDWGYPNTVDMTLYKKHNIAKIINNINYSSPNQLEDPWALKPPQRPTGLCYTFSKIINIPINRVQSTHNNRNMNLFSSSELLTYFENGYKIDIKPFFSCNNISAHAECQITFTTR